MGAEDGERKASRSDMPHLYTAANQRISVSQGYEFSPKTLGPCQHGDELVTLP